MPLGARKVKMRCVHKANVAAACAKLKAMVKLAAYCLFIRSSFNDAF
jgi:hypothetical protein